VSEPAKPPSRPPALAVYLLGVVGGLVGTVAAVYQEVLHGVWLAVVLVGPAIEEACKPIGVILMLEKFPHWLRSRRQVLLMAALGALVFATLENLVYVHFYRPTGGPGFVAWRFTVCTGVHVAATAVFGAGLAKMWRRIRETGGSFDIDVIFRHYVAAVAIHAAYNTTVLILGFTKWLKF
jgi:RsiW-degrading membrane proteinase PrsW (M82 family)